MPREKKQKLKKRPDGRYACRYHDQWFYSYDADDCLRQREEFKAQEKRGLIMSYFVREYAEKWLDRTYPNISPSTKKGYNIHLQTLLSAIGDIPIADVKPSDIKGVYSGHYSGLSNSYVKAAKQLYCALFDSAVADGLITANPARDRTAKPHKGKSGGHRAITDQERVWINALCTDHRAWPAVMFMLYAGVRPQEAKAIDIDRDVDFINDLITIRETAHIDGQKYAYTTEGKTEHSNRQIPLFPPLKQALKGKHGYLITSAHGERVTIQTFKTAWQSYIYCMEKAINGIDKRWYGKTREQKALADQGKLPAWIDFDIVPYTLRHGFCEMCRSAGVELNTCRHWMGHSDAKMILKVYDSVSEDRSENERKKIESGLFGVQNGVQHDFPKAKAVEK